MNFTHILIFLLISLGTILFVLQTFNIQHYESQKNTFSTKNDLKNAIDSWLYNKKEAIEEYGHIKDWDTSRIKDMSDLFRGIENFNEDLSNWDVSNVTNMSGMFENAHNFNGNLSKWNTSRVEDMSNMFKGAREFNQPINTNTKENNWNVSEVTNMNGMFENAHEFNQDLSEWDVSKVTDMSAMFREAQSFNQTLSNWDTSNVVLMISMFERAYNFNNGYSECSLNQLLDSMWLDKSDLNKKMPDFEIFFSLDSESRKGSKWNVSKVEDMHNMFRDARDFSVPVDNWDTGKVKDMSNMFRNAYNFNRSIISWNVKIVNDMSNMFRNAYKFNQFLIFVPFAENIHVSDMIKIAKNFKNGYYCIPDVLMRKWEDEWYGYLEFLGIDISNLINCNNVDGMCITEISTNDILELSGDTDKTTCDGLFQTDKNSIQDEINDADIYGDSLASILSKRNVNFSKQFIDNMKNFKDIEFLPSLFSRQAKNVPMMKGKASDSPMLRKYYWNSDMYIDIEELDGIKEEEALRKQKEEADLLKRKKFLEADNQGRQLTEEEKKEWGRIYLK